MSGTAAPKEKRLRTPAKKHAEHPEHAIMIVEAIATLKERSGSSTAAINKVIGDKYKGKLPTGWERVTSQQLQRLLDKGELVKVKASYKLGEQDVLKKKPKAKQSKAESEKEVVEPKSDKLKEGEKKKKKKAGATPNEAEKAVPKKAAEKKPAKAKAPKARAEKKKPAAKPKAAQPEAAKA